MKDQAWVYTWAIEYNFLKTDTSVEDFQNAGSQETTGHLLQALETTDDS